MCKTQKFCSFVLRSILRIKKKKFVYGSENSEGYDRIPQRILIDGISILMGPFEKLFNLIYITNTIPDQWAKSKIIPIYFYNVNLFTIK